MSISVNADQRPPAAPSGARRDVPRWVAAATVVLAAGVLAAVQWQSFGPQFGNDEVGNLGNAMLFAHPGTAWLLTGSAYMPGMSVLLTPVWWVTSDPALAYRLAIVICALVALAAVWPLAELARRFGAPPRLAVVFAAIVVVAPSRALASNYVWAENLLFLCVVWTMVLALRLAERPTARVATAFGLVAAGAFVAHGRAAPFAVGAIVAAAVLLRRHRPYAVRALLTWLVVAGGGYLLFRYASQTLYVASDRVESTVADLGRVTPGGFAITAVSQWWYQTAAWAGLTIIGALTLFAKARAQRWRGGATAVASLVVLMALVTPLLIADSPDGAARMEAHFYGRYADAFLAPLAVIGLARLLRPIRARARVLLAVSSVASAAAFLVVCVPGIPRGISLTPIHAAGVAYLLHPEYVVTGDAENWPFVALVTVVPALVVVALGAWRLVVAAAVAVWFGSVTVVTDHVQYDRFEGGRPSPSIVAAVAGIDSSIPVYAQPSSPYAVSHNNLLTFWFTPHRYAFIDTSRDTAGVQMFVGEQSSTFAVGRGALPLRDSAVGTAVVWIFPGPLQDRLAAQGRLVPQSGG